MTMCLPTGGPLPREPGQKHRTIRKQTSDAVFLIRCSGVVGACAKADRRSGRETQEEVRENPTSRYTFSLHVTGVVFLCYIYLKSSHMENLQVFNQDRTSCKLNWGGILMCHR